MNFSTVKAITIPEGPVIKITQGGVVLWQKQAEETSIDLIDQITYSDDTHLNM